MNTIEGAIVLSAMTVVVAGSVAGFVTLAEASTAQALARDAARAGALGEDAAGYVSARDSEASVQVKREKIGEIPVMTVSVTKSAPLILVTKEAAVITEPTGDE